MGCKKVGESGQGMLEYAMIIIIIAVLVLVSIVLFGGLVGNLYSNVVLQV
jgi:pilus assembly protein Flp/PilA